MLARSIDPGVMKSEAAASAVFASRFGVASGVAAPRPAASGSRG
jgi:hypothetical protein